MTRRQVVILCDLHPSPGLDPQRSDLRRVAVEFGVVLGAVNLLIIVCGIVPTVLAQAVAGRVDIGGLVTTPPQDSSMFTTWPWPILPRVRSTSAWPAGPPTWPR